MTSLRVTASPGFGDGRSPHLIARFADQLPQAGVTDALDVLVVLQHRAEGGVHHAGVELLLAEGDQRLRPVDRLGDARRLGQVEPAQLLHEGGGLGGQALRHAGHAGAHDLDLALERGVPDPVVEAAALESVVQLAGAVRGEDHQRPPLGPDRPDLGDRDLEVREQLQQEGLELVVGAVDLVDQQHRRLRVVVVDRVQQRPALEELRAEQLVQALLAAAGLGGLERADVEQLPGVVPVVEGVRDVDALVALEADQAGAEDVGHHLGELGLADPASPSSSSGFSSISDR